MKSGHQIIVLWFWKFQSKLLYALRIFLYTMEELKKDRKNRMYSVLMSTLSREGKEGSYLVVDKKKIEMEDEKALC